MSSTTTQMIANNASIHPAKTPSPLLLYPSHPKKRTILIRSYVAIAEKIEKDKEKDKEKEKEKEKDKQADIKIFDLKSQRRKKVFMAPQELGIKEYISIDFYPLNELYLISLGGGYLIYWKWDSSKIQATEKVEGTHCSFSPEGLHIAVTGNNIFRFYELIKQDADALTPILSKIMNVPEDISTNYTYHAFTPSSQLAISTASGHILILGLDGSLVKIYDGKEPLYSLVATKKGLVAGGKGFLSVYSGTQKESDPYRFETQTYFKEQAALKELEMSNEIVACVDLSCFTSSVAAILTSNNQLLKASINFTSSPIVIDFMICEFHSKGINGMDLCIRKPLIVTCSKEDKTVKIWNYVQRKLELSVKYPDELLNVAFHPSGFHLVIGMQDKIIMVNVLSNKLTTPILQQSLKLIDFSLSNGGHLLAVSDLVNQNKITVYNFYTFIPISNLDDKIKHTNRVKTIKWFDDDSGFCSSDMGGSIIEWKFSEIGGLPSSPFVERQKVFTSMIRVPDEEEGKDKNDKDDKTAPNIKNKIYAVCGEKTIRVLKSGEVVFQHDVGMPVSQLSIMKTMKQKSSMYTGRMETEKQKQVLMFAGRAEAGKPGTLRLIKFPQCNESAELQVHSQEIEKIAVNSTDQFLITCSKDGSIYIFDVKDRDKLKDMDELPIVYSEEMLSNVEEQNDLIKKKANLTQQKLDAMSETNKEQIQNKSEEAIRTAQTELISITKINEDKKNDIKDNTEKDSKKFEADIAKKAEEYVNELDELTNKYSKELINKNTEYSEETVKKDEKEKQMNRELGELTEKYKNELNKKQEEYKAEEDKKEEELFKKKDSMQYSDKQDNERMDQLQTDLFTEDQKVKEKNDENIKKVNDAIGKTKGDLQNSKKKIQENLQKKQELERSLQDKEAERSNKLTEQSELIKDKESKEKEKKQKDEEIGRLEDNIYTLKKETQELEKFKYVLDYKIKELKKDISPREKEIQNLKAQTNEMDQDLKDFNKYNSHLGLIVKELERRLSEKKQNIAQQRNSIRENEVKIKRMKDGVYTAVQDIKDYPKLVKNVNELKNEFVKKKIVTQQIESEIKKEYEEQKEYLIQSVNILKTQLDTDSAHHKDDNNKIRNENKRLIEEINKLRKEINPKGDTKQFKDTQMLDDKLRENSARIKQMQETLKKLKTEYDILQQNQQ